jgi:chromosome segregation ATPase
MDTVKQLTDVCSSLKLRLDEFENEEATKMTSSSEIESKITSVDTDHREININVQNTLRSVQELECRVISLELDKENDQRNSDEVMLYIKDIENDKSKLQENLNEVLKGEQEQRSKVSSLESQLGSLNNQISELQIENKNIKDLLDESTKSNHTKDEKLSSMQKTENSLQNTIRNLESKIEHYEARHKSETEEISVSKKRLEKLEGQLREKEIAHQETIRKLAEVQNKQEDLQKR